MSLDQDEQLFVDALHRTTVTPPDLAEVALRATRTGTRLRRRHQAGAAVATLAVVGVSGAAVLAAGGHHEHRTDTQFADTPSATAATDPTATPAPATPTAQPSLDTSSAYAVLDAPGWSAPVDNVIADEKLYYVQDGSDASITLNWRPSQGLGSKYTEEQEQAELDARYGGDVVVGTTTIDGDPANIFGEAGMFTVVGPIKQGRFLTFSGSGLTLAEITELATHVHRQAAEHLAGQTG
jgi:hypothetical protein